MPLFSWINWGTKQGYDFQKCWASTRLLAPVWALRQSGPNDLFRAYPEFLLRAGNRNPGVLTSILDVKPVATLLLTTCSQMTFSWSKLKHQQSLFITGTVCWRWPLKKSFEEQMQQPSSAKCCWCGLEGVWEPPWGCGKRSPKGSLGDAPSLLVRKFKRNPSLSSTAVCRVAPYEDVRPSTL